MNPVLYRAYRWMLFYEWRMEIVIGNVGIWSSPVFNAAQKLLQDHRI